MDRRERFPDLETALLAMMEGAQSRIWTAMPGIIASYNAAAQTCSIRVALKMQFLQEDGTYTTVEIQPLVDCPVIFPSGGGFSLTFPVAPGDECLAVFANRCIDSWWQLGDVQVQAEFRMHNLSDGFALLGPRSQPHVLSPSANSTSVELRNDAHTAYVAIDGSANITVQSAGNVTATAAGSITATAPTINVNGNVNIVGDVTITGALHANGKNIGSAHTHSSVAAGTATSGGPT